MTLPDISKLTVAELQELAGTIQLIVAQGIADEAVEVVNKKKKAEEAIAVLTALLGVENGTPNVETIRGVLAFTDQQLVANSGIAFRLILKGMEVLTKTTLNLAYISVKER